MIFGFEGQRSFRAIECKRRDLRSVSTKDKNEAAVRPVQARWNPPSFSLNCLHSAYILAEKPM